MTFIRLVSHGSDATISLVDVCVQAIPRIKLRHKAASDTLRPLLEELGGVLTLASSHATQNEACDILSSISKLSINIDKWVASIVTDESKDDRATCKVCPSYLSV